MYIRILRRCGYCSRMWLFHRCWHEFEEPGKRTRVRDRTRSRSRRTSDDDLTFDDDTVTGLDLVGDETVGDETVNGDERKRATPDSPTALNR